MENPPHSQHTSTLPAHLHTPSTPPPASNTSLCPTPPASNTPLCPAPPARNTPLCPPPPASNPPLCPTQPASNTPLCPTPPASNTPLCPTPPASPYLSHKCSQGLPFPLLSHRYRQTPAQFHTYVTSLY